MTTKQKPMGIEAMFSTNRKLEITNLFALVAGGIFIKIFFYSSGPANSTIWGYSLSVMALFLLTVISITLDPTNKPSSTNSNLGSNLFRTFFEQGLPPITLLLLLIWAIGMAIKYFKQMEQGNLPQEFYSYSFISSFLLILQAISLFTFFNARYNLLYTENKPEDKQKNLKNSLSSTSIMYVLTTFNTIILGLMQIILAFFLTDG